MTLLAPTRGLLGGARKRRSGAGRSRGQDGFGPPAGCAPSGRAAGILAIGTQKAGSREGKGALKAKSLISIKIRARGPTEIGSAARKGEADARLHAVEQPPVGIPPAGRPRFANSPSQTGVPRLPNGPA